MSHGYRNSSQQQIGAGLDTAWDHITIFWRTFDRLFWEQAAQWGAIAGCWALLIVLATRPGPPPAEQMPAAAVEPRQEINAASKSGTSASDS